MNDKTALTLEAGKFYKTRIGKKAFVAGLCPFSDINIDCRATGFIEGRTQTCDWMENGTWGLGVVDDRDLVAEWVEPKRIKGWLNIYGDRRSGILHCARGSADSVGHGRIACIEIDVLEGAGLGEVA